MGVGQYPLHPSGRRVGFLWRTPYKNVPTSKARRETNIKAWELLGSTLFLFFLVLAIPIFIFAEPIIVLLFGIEYKPAGVLLALLSIRLFFANMGVARGTYILTENLMKFSMLTMILGQKTL